jgi:hypothetical protein
MASAPAIRPFLSGAHGSTIRHLVDTADRFRLLVHQWRRLGHGARADRCTAHLAPVRALIEDMRRGSPRLLRRLADEALHRDYWEAVSTYEERAALAKQRAAADGIRP